MVPRYVLSDSEDEPETQSAPTRPSAQAMEKALREAVARTFKSGDMSELTVKRMRIAAEKKLGLDDGFFKGSVEWKGKSDWIIKDEVNVLDLAAQEEEARSLPKTSEPEPAKTAKPAKRANTEDVSKARKRRKASTPSDHASPDEETEEDVRAPVRKQSKATSKSSASQQSSKRASAESESGVEEVQAPSRKQNKAKSRANQKPSQPEGESEFEEEIREPARKQNKTTPKPNASRKSSKVDSEESEFEEDEEARAPAKKNKATPKSNGSRRSSKRDSDESESEEEDVHEPPKRQKATPKTSRKSSKVDSEPEEEQVKRPAKRSKSKSKSKEPEPKSPHGDTDQSDVPNGKPFKETNGKGDTGQDGSESEMSVVYDEEPPKPSHKTQKKSSEEPSGKAQKKGGKGKDADLDPDQAEIKRLQGWLLKCGIRKMWARELAPYDSPKAKVKHLKKMLKDVGMEGRYSVDKANRIREERELQADLEMVQEGAKRWGRRSDDDDSDRGRPRRRLTQGRKSLAFLENMGEGEETD